jgi:hypothetical protein
MQRRGFSGEIGDIDEHLAGLVMGQSVARIK